MALTPSEKAAAISKLCPGAEFFIRSGVLTWVDGHGYAQPTDAEIEAAFSGMDDEAPPPSPPAMIAAMLQVTIEDGQVASVAGAFNIAAAIYIDVGIYMLLFNSEWPDNDYYAVITGGAPCMDTTESDTSFLMISALDAVGGSPIDPAQFSVQIYRI